MITDAAILEIQEVLVRADLLAERTARKSNTYYAILRVLEVIITKPALAPLKETTTFKKLYNFINYNKCLTCRDKLLEYADYYQRNHRTANPVKNFIEEILKRGYIFELYQTALSNKKDWENIVYLCLDRLEKYKYTISPTSLAYFEGNLRNLTRNNKMPYTNNDKIDSKQLMNDVLNKANKLQNMDFSLISDANTTSNTLMADEEFENRLNQISTIHFNEQMNGGNINSDIYDYNLFEE